MFDALVGLARESMRRRQLVLLYTSMVGETIAPEHPAHSGKLRHFELSEGLLADGLREDQRSGHVRPDAPVERIARSMIALMDGLQVQWLLDPKFDMGADLAEHVEELKRNSGTTR